MKQKIIIGSILFLGFLLAFWVGYGKSSIYDEAQNSQPPSPSPIPKVSDKGGSSSKTIDALSITPTVLASSSSVIDYDVTTWHTYMNNSYGITFKYPNVYSIYDDMNSGYIIRHPNKLFEVHLNHSEGTAFELSIGVANAFPKFLFSVSDIDFNKNLPRETNLGGHPAKYYRINGMGDGGSSVDKIYISQINDVYYYLVYSSYNSPKDIFFNQILSSLKIDVSTIDSSTWKKQTLPDLGISLMLPNDWELRAPAGYMKIVKTKDGSVENHTFTLEPKSNKEPNRDIIVTGYIGTNDRFDTSDMIETRRQVGTRTIVIFTAKDPTDMNGHAYIPLTAEASMVLMFRGNANKLYFDQMVESIEYQ